MIGSKIALKEWAVLVEALAGGKQLLLIRKGGIHDPEAAFQLEQREFFLYPTLEHQQEAYVRPEFRALFHSAEQAGKEGGTHVELQLYAGVAYEKQIKDPLALAGLEKYHIWSRHFLEERGRYKPEHPTWVLMLRAYRLLQPVRQPVRPEYAGCKSWVELSEAISLEGAHPVLDNQRFRAALEEISSRL